MLRCFSSCVTFARVALCLGGADEGFVAVRVVTDEVKSVALLCT